MIVRPAPIRRRPCLRARVARRITVWLTTPRKDTMTTNIDRAAGYIAECITRDSDPAQDIAQYLADVGLLLPDMPEPDRHGCLWPRHGRNYGHVQSPRFTGTGNVIIARGAGSLALTCEEALELASLLTAAAYAERNQA